MEHKILVFYIGIAGINLDDVQDYIQKVIKKISPDTFKGEIIVIPTHTYDTRVECINPKYITNEKLIQEHENLMKELNHKLHNQLKEIENEKD
jgi:hypothetical protein